MGMWVQAGMMALSAYNALQQSKGGGSGGGSGTPFAALEDAMRDQTATKATERPLEEIKPATDTTKQTAEYFARIADAIESNGSVRELVHMLRKDMETTKGGNISSHTVPPEKAKIPETQSLRETVLGRPPGVKLTQPEQKEPEPVEPFVPHSLFG